MKKGKLNTINIINTLIDIIEFLISFILEFGIVIPIYYIYFLTNRYIIKKYEPVDSSLESFDKIEDTTDYIYKLSERIKYKCDEVYNDLYTENMGFYSKKLFKQALNTLCKNKETSKFVYNNRELILRLGKQEIAKIIDLANKCKFDEAKDLCRNSYEKILGYWVDFSKI